MILRTTHTLFSNILVSNQSSPTMIIYFVQNIPQRKLLTCHEGEIFYFCRGLKLYPKSCQFGLAYATTLQHDHPETCICKTYHSYKLNSQWVPYIQMVRVGIHWTNFCRSTLLIISWSNIWYCSVLQWLYWHFLADSCVIFTHIIHSPLIGTWKSYNTPELLKYNWSMSVIATHNKSQ